MAANLSNHFDCNMLEITSRLNWYSPETGIYCSKHTLVELPSDPFLDVVSYIFSHQHNGASALIDASSGCSISYPELFPLVKSLASGLHKMGVSQGDVVLLMIPNTIFYPIIFLGVLYLGAIVTPLNPHSSISEIRKHIDDCGVSLAFTVQEKVRKLQPFGIPIIGVPENLRDSKHAAFSIFNNLVSGNFDLFPRPLVRQEDTAAIMYSSGTTGVSKGVVLTHKNFVSMIELFVKFEASQYEYSSLKSVFLAVLPMFHIYGLSLFATGLLSLGSTVVVMRKFDINEVINVIEKYKVTHIPAVPPMLTALTKRVKGINGSYLQSLIQVSCGAAPLSRKTIEDFVHTFPNVDFIQVKNLEILRTYFEDVNYHSLNCLSYLLLLKLSMVITH